MFRMRYLEHTKRGVSFESILQRMFGVRRRKVRIHVAAVCYRSRAGKLELLLMQTRDRHWTFPKGGVEDDPGSGRGRRGD